MKLGTGARETFASAVKSLGGDMLPDACEGSRVVSQNLASAAITCECGTKSRAAIPYAGSKDFAVVCAICDHAFDAPRIREKA